MKRILIRWMKGNGMTNDQIYERGVCLLGLYGIAFFGHKGTKAEKQKLSRLWNQVLTT